MRKNIEKHGKTGETQRNTGKLGELEKNVEKHGKTGRIKEKHRKTQGKGETQL